MFQSPPTSKHGPPDAAPTALDPKITTRGRPGGTAAGAAPSGADGSGAAALPLAALEVDGPVVQG